MKAEYSRALILISFFVIVSAGTVWAGQAPAFVLPAVDGNSFVSSDDIFGAGEFTFLVFWDSGCDKCAEKLAGCEEFFLDASGSGIQVYGIAGDETESGGLGALIESAAVTFPQLRDRGRSVGSAYGVAPSTVSVFLVDGTGRVISSVRDPEGEMTGVLEEMLLATPAEGAEETGGVRAAAGSLGFTMRGGARIKFLSVDTEGEAAVGPYGEELSQGNSLLQRYQLEISKGIGRHLRVGGLLRISNEGIIVLRSGPEYFDSEYGSVFAEGDYGRFGFRFGYFTMNISPLTLMRWDWDDNPRTGGDAGCGCGAAGGIMIVESLEELGPDLTFEGALARFRAGGVSTKVFYAMPRRARDTNSAEYQFGGEESACYSLEMFGLTSVWRRYDRRTGSHWSAGIHVVGTREDPESIDPVALGYAPFERHDSEIVTLTASLPLIRRVGLLGEWIAYNNTRGYNLGAMRDEEAEYDGAGGIAGVEIDGGERYRVRVDYQRLSGEFFSPFAALSYEPGREGARASGRLALPGGWSSLQVFYKRHQGTEAPESGAEKDDLSFGGVTFDVETPSGAGGSISFLDRHEWRSGDVQGFDDRRRTWTAALRYRFDPETWIEGMYQRIDSELAGTSEGESKTDILSLYLRAAF